MRLEEHRESDQEIRYRPASPQRRISQALGGDHGSVAIVLVAVLTVVALVLRFWHLGSWNFQATEIFTWRDSQSPQFSNPRPLGYLLNYYLVRPFLPLDEFGLRLLPAVFGVLAIPAMYFVSRRLVGTRAALLVALLLAVNPLHILYSQLARYWSLVFLLSAIYPVAIYIGIRERNRRALVLGLVTCVLAVLAHPVSVLPLGGLAIWVLTTYLPPSQVARTSRQIWSHRRARWWAVAAALVSVIVLARLAFLLEGWISQHDKHPGAGQFLNRAPVAPGLKQLVFLSAYAESLTVPLVITGVAGLYLLWKERDRQLAWLLTCLAAIPLVFIPLLSLRTSVSTYYVLPTAPVFFIGAGVFLDRLFDVDWKMAPRWLAAVTVTALIVTAGIPTIFSDYRDGRRYDFRKAAQWLEKNIGPEDAIYSDQHMVLGYYLNGRPVERLRYDTTPLREWLRVHQSGNGGALWIIAPAPSHVFRTNLRRGGLADWMYGNCQLRQTLGVGRLDIRQNYLQVYRCPPNAPLSAAASPGGSKAHSDIALRRAR
jgi:hypothetical protein